MSSTIILWGLHDGKRLREIAMRTRDDVRLWAGARFISSKHYGEAKAMYGRGHQFAMELWSIVQFNHPAMRIVRVTVSK